MRISILFVGALRDGGFNQSALDGAERMQADPAAGEIEIVDGIPYDPAAMTSALKAAAGRSDGVVFVGGQGNLVTPPVAEAFAECAFAVVQGAVTAPNLASYDVLQEQSAFLAGVLAARHTQTGCVGHLSGHRVVPGLKGRAAFAAGVRHADPDVRLITGFCGTQDDSTVTEAWATRIADAGADVLFTMLNAARDGATRACRVTGMRQIGNVTDWCAAEPEVFVASALARIDLGVVRAVQDMRAGRGAGSIVRLGLAEGAVGLAMGPEVPAGLRTRIDATAAQVSAGELQVSTTYDGPEIEAAA
ncbi:BMP family ABC transporter substrate-binding protein [Jannaschia sp. M317]|uniref:BMP family ABC transporter substrate-binding protein n=1 Tax=Jannaschia sp. M317 TaxID=2867011 RepID=UPI0021A3AD98|nr:BMP family ABC transporter substrate-binding protein [Jannaschia sp. M317]UWQ17764.1 BMP family ABC transporter substrate-binding protein [Jannaschia sp. M317]